MPEKEIEIFYPETQLAWRKWLEANYDSASNVWVVFYRKSSEKPSISWSEAVDVALCFGWIDSKKIAIDNEKSHQFFTKRKPKSTWSKINKDKIEHLIATKQMNKAGLISIETAKRNGSWNMLDQVEALIIPKDLETELKATPKTFEYFLSLSKSARKNILQWIMFAKREETRKKRITEIVAMANNKEKPRQY